MPALSLPQPYLAWNASALVLCCAFVAACDQQPKATKSAAQPAESPSAKTAQHSPGAIEAPKPADDSPAPATPAFEEEPATSREGIATWYDVPDGSLPERRAPAELTAAHDRIPLGKYVRVTNKRNDKSIVVRITDNGVGKGSVIDLCKEAAEEIDLIGRGVAKVRIEVLKERPLETPPGT